MQVVIYCSWSIFYIVNIYCHQDRLFDKTAEFMTRFWFFQVLMVISRVLWTSVLYFFFSQCDTCLLCLKLPYNVYTYTSNCWINSSINITLEPQPAFTTLTTCAGLFCIWRHFNTTGYFHPGFHILKFHKYWYIVLQGRYSSTLLTYFTLW